MISLSVSHPLHDNLPAPSLPCVQTCLFVNVSDSHVIADLRSSLLLAAAKYQPVLSSTQAWRHSWLLTVTDSVDGDGSLSCHVSPKESERTISSAREEGWVGEEATLFVNLFLFVSLPPPLPSPSTLSLLPLLLPLTTTHHHSSPTLHQTTTYSSHLQLGNVQPLAKFQEELRETGNNNKEVKENQKNSRACA